MIYITGDKHGKFDTVSAFCAEMKTKKEDILIVLGDAGINTGKLIRDMDRKDMLEELPITLLCIHGNHEQRPETIFTYKEKNWHGGRVFYEEHYPHLLFARDGSIFDLNGKSTIILGGAYSVDKMYRLAWGLPWWPDEQMSSQARDYALEQMEQREWKIDVVLSHTAPLKYLPVSSFLPGIDQSSVDRSTELWLDELESRLDYEKWYCGHFHVERKIERLEFMYENFARFA